MAVGDYGGCTACNQAFFFFISFLLFLPLHRQLIRALYHEDSVEELLAEDPNIAEEVGRGEDGRVPGLVPVLGLALASALHLHSSTELTPPLSPFTCQRRVAQERLMALNDANAILSKVGRVGGIVSARASPTGFIAPAKALTLFPSSFFRSMRLACSSSVNG